MSKVSKIATISLLLVCLIATAASARLVLDDPLTETPPPGVTRAVTSGGDFLDDGSGWKVTGQTDHISWEIPSVSHGAIEFDVRGLNKDEARMTMAEASELFAMYDISTCNIESYDCFRNNSYKMFINKYGDLRSWPPDHIDYCRNQMKILWNYPGTFYPEAYEVVTPTQTWFPTENYRFRLEWKPDGLGGFNFWIYRNYVLFANAHRSGLYNPPRPAIRIAHNRTDTFCGAPIDAVYSRIKVWDLSSESIPREPEIESPTSGSTWRSGLVCINWKGDNHTKYQVKICATDDPNANVVWDSGEAASNKDYAWTGKLSNMANYYVFVRLGTAAGWSGWSASGRWFRVDNSSTPPSNIVKMSGHSYEDGNGPFLGLGITYMDAMWMCKNNRAGFREDLQVMKDGKFNYIRILSEVPGPCPQDYWHGHEINASTYMCPHGVWGYPWSDYDQQFRDTIDIAYDEYGIRTEVCIFGGCGDSFPTYNGRQTHCQRILNLLQEREHKVVFIEIGNEAWQTGFDIGEYGHSGFEIYGGQGRADIRSLGEYVAARTSIPVALTSPTTYYEGDTPTNRDTLILYGGSVADIATEHHDRNIHTSEGHWRPVRDSWRSGDVFGLPPISSDEPIGPGASVNTEDHPIHLVSAAIFAYISNLPSYVFHSDAGVRRIVPFAGLPGIDKMKYLTEVLSPDMSSWIRNDGKESSAPFTAFSNNQPDKYWTDVSSPTSGCHRNIGARKGVEFVCYPMGILPGNLTLQARQQVTFRVYNPLNGQIVVDVTTLNTGQQLTLNYSDGEAFIIKGVYGTSLPGWKNLEIKYNTAPITIDGNSSDWNLAQFTKPIRGGESGSGDYAVVGFDSGNLYYGSRSSGEALPTNAADHTAKVYGRNDANYQYFLVRCDDDDMRYSLPIENNWQNDCVEFYIDPSDDNGLNPISSSTSDIQLVIDANNQKNVYCCTDAYKNQVLAGVTSVVTRDATGWWLEVRITKSALDPDLTTTGTYGLDFCFRDNDNANDPTKTTVYTWNDSSGVGFPSKIPTNWGSGFMDGINNAQYISDTIPATMDAGQQYNVSVTMRNTGTNIWTTSRDYKLGAVDNSDPLATTRQLLSGSDSIAPNAQKTFSFVMTAPPATGTYTTDWQMLREMLQWFGDILSKQITVVNTLPPGPVTNLIATPGDGRVTLSWTNPTNSDFTGTLVRYKTSGYPTSVTDGTLVADVSGLPGSNGSCIQTGLTNGTTYYFAAFAHDAVPNNATGVNVSGVPTDACFVETFPYANGNLSGNGGWSGSAGGEIVVSSQAVKYNGGNEGNLDAIRSVTTCGSVTGSVGVSAKIRAGYGTGVMWSMFIDDTSGNNLARCYGSATSVRGRIGGGGTVTPSEVPLTGNWDDIYVKINFASNTSSFYLNGALLGTLSHAETGAGDSIGRIRLMRDSNLTTAGYYMFLDNISIGPADTTAPVPFISAPWVPTIKTGQVKYTVTFSEPVIGFAAADIQVNKTGAVSSGSASVSGTNPYTVTIGSVSGNGTISISVKAASVVDAAGNTNALTAAATKCVVISADGSVATAKTAAENATVTIGNKILYYKNGTVGYVEEADRFTGLRIEGSIPSLLDDKVSLSGQIKTNVSGERYVLLEQVATVGTGTVGALGTNNRGAKLAVMDGLLTTVWGIVKAGSITSNSFVISDGSDEEGIKIITIGAPGVTENSYVTVTGAAGKEAGKRVIFKN